MIFPVLRFRRDRSVRTGRVPEVARRARRRPGAGHARRLQADHLRGGAAAPGGLLVHLLYISQKFMKITLSSTVCIHYLKLHTHIS